MISSPVCCILYLRSFLFHTIMIRQRPALCKSRALYFRGCLTPLVRQPRYHWMGFAAPPWLPFQGRRASPRFPPHRVGAARSRPLRRSRSTFNEPPSCVSFGRLRASPTWRGHMSCPIILYKMFTHAIVVFPSRISKKALRRPLFARTEHPLTEKSRFILSFQNSCDFDRAFALG